MRLALPHVLDEYRGRYPNGTRANGVGSGGSASGTVVGIARATHGLIVRGIDLVAEAMRPALALVALYHHRVVLGLRVRQIAHDTELALLVALAARRATCMELRRVEGIERHARARLGRQRRVRTRAAPDAHATIVA